MTKLRMIPCLRGLLVCGLLTVLVACTNQQTPGTPAPGSQLRAAVGQFLNRNKPPLDVRTLLTPAFLAQAPRPFMVVENETSKASSTMSIAGRNGDVASWVTGDLSTIAMNGLGVVQATRGFGRDLMTADTRALMQALRQGGSQNALRVHRYLDGENKVLTYSYVCSVTQAGRDTVTLATGSFATILYREDCKAARGDGFTNEYWYDPGAGVLRQSRQWISPELGTLLFERLYS